MPLGQLPVERLPLEPMSLGAAAVMWGSRDEVERRNRISLSVAAYAYEFHADSIMSDDEYDQLALEITPGRPTGHPVLDDFFRRSFSPDTGMWVRNHPELERLAAVYATYWRK
jgi:hypothetical protein